MFLMRRHRGLRVRAGVGRGVHVGLRREGDAADEEREDLA
jgi:hypothetical protein